TAASGSLTDIFSAADSACFVAKEQGRNRIHLFHPEDTALAQRHGQMQWMHRIKTALQENRFSLYCEPFTPLNAQAEERSIYEILVRLIDEQGVAITPMEFIPAAERYHIMPAIDRWVIAATFSILASAAPQSSRVIYTINLSGQSLGDDNFLDFILFQFELTGVAPSNICFEITETAAIGNITRALRLINTLKSMGSRFALDDFGTGLSSFSYLKNIPVDALKIDGAFVRNMQHDKIDHALVETISRIGHIMGLTTIAEHVTNPDTLEVVRALGIDYAQGHAFAKTTPLEGVVRQHQMITPPAHD
ncbi:MAG: hypothetical protein FD130_1274, partial [Halothiobacillaceae bacterium]